MSDVHAYHADARLAWLRTPTGVTVIGFALVAAFFVLREQWGHVLGFAPYLLLVACLLIHLFMHGGHGHHHGGAPRSGDRT